MEWKQLISNKRFGQEHKHAERHDDRSEFKRDYDRLIFSSAGWLKPLNTLTCENLVTPVNSTNFKSLSAALKTL